MCFFQHIKFWRKQDDNETDSDEELKNVLEDGQKDYDIYKICQVNKDSLP